MGQNAPKKRKGARYKTSRSSSAPISEAASPSYAYEVSWRVRREGVRLSAKSGIHPGIWFPRSSFKDSASYSVALALILGRQVPVVKLTTCALVKLIIYEVNSGGATRHVGSNLGIMHYSQARSKAWWSDDGVFAKPGDDLIKRAALSHDLLEALSRDGLRKDILIAINRTADAILKLEKLITSVMLPDQSDGESRVVEGISEKARPER